MTRQITNKHSGTCRHCGAKVGVAQGFAQLDNPEAKWKVACAPCVSGETPTPVSRVVPVEERPTFALTEEQEIAVALFGQGQSIAIQAGAGAGKTSTLVAIAKSTTRTGQYVAFNSAIVKDASAKLPSNVGAATAHSLAFRQVGKRYKHRLDSSRQSSNEIARRLRLDPCYVQTGDVRKVIQPTKLAGYVMRAIGRFCNSADSVPGPQHMEYIDGIDLPAIGGDRTYAANDQVREHCRDAIAIAWDDIKDPAGQLRFSHSNYLKIWELGIHGAPVIPGEFILFDEAQDSSPVLLSAVSQQGKQVVFVGDENQSIMEWAGAVDAMRNLPSESTCHLTHSFRFGQEIADVANKVLALLDTEMRMVGRGAPGKVEAHTAPDAILTRTNAGAIAAVLQSMSAGRQPHLVGGGGEVERFAKGARDLMEGRTTEHPELCIFENWSQVQVYAEQDALGSELAPMVKLIDDEGVETILKAVGNAVSEQDADVVVSTAHKSKGREWGSVRLAGDFPSDRMDEGEYRLLYVAMTRAKVHLDIEGCSAAIDIVFPGRAQEAQMPAISHPVPTRRLPSEVGS